MATIIAVTKVATTRAMAGMSTLTKLKGGIGMRLIRIAAQMADISTHAGLGEGLNNGVGWRLIHIAALRRCLPTVY
jgi:hypothetical protein